MAGARCATRDARPIECPPPREKPPPRRASTDAVLKSVMAIKTAALVETNAAVLMGILPFGWRFRPVRTCEAREPDPIVLGHNQ